jgi:hypothetical protein
MAAASAAVTRSEGVRRRRTRRGGPGMDARASSLGEVGFSGALSLISGSYRETSMKVANLSDLLCVL